MWVPLTVDGLKSAMTSKEVADFGKSVTDGAPDDRVVPILADLVEEIRGYIRSQADNVLSADATLIPPEFKAKAYVVARHRLLTSIPGYQPGDARKDDYDRADKFFIKVAEGKIRPQAPGDTDPEAPAPRVGTWNSENKVLGRTHPVPPPGTQGASGGYANPDGPSDRT